MYYRFSQPFSSPAQHITATKQLWKTYILIPQCPDMGKVWRCFNVNEKYFYDRPTSGENEYALSLVIDLNGNTPTLKR